MAASAPSTRRDRRYDLRPGSATIELPNPHADGRSRARLVRISVSGLTFELPRASVKLERGAWLENVTIRVGECVLHGEAQVRNLTRIADTRTEVGCLFLPEARGSEDKWLALIAGIDATRAD